MCCGTAMLAMCAGKEVCGCVCPSSGRGAQVNYLTMMFISVLISCFLRAWGGNLISGISVESLSLCTTTACYGVEAVFRISFALFLFFMLMAAFATSRNCAKYDDSGWFAKVGLFLGLLLLVWFLPDGFYDSYAAVARYMSGFFLLFQILQLISGAYEWDIEWTERNYKKLYLGTCLVMDCLCIAALVVLYIEFSSSPDGSCTRNILVITSNFLLSLGYSLVSITEWCDHGRKLPSSVVTLYCYWLTFSAMLSDPTECNGTDFANKGGVNEDPVYGTIYFALSIVWVAISVCYAAWNAATNETVFGSSAEGGPADEAMLVPSDEVDSVKYTEPISVNAPADPEARMEESADMESKRMEDHESARKSRIGPQFHLILALCSMYVATLLSGWGDRQDADSISMGELDVGWTPFWIKTTCMWITSVLYLFTLIAPRIFPDRDFGHGYSD